MNTTVIHITVSAFHAGIAVVLLLAVAGFIAWFYMHEHEKESRWQ